ncbi:glutathione S-transferase family protein [Sphingomonas jeddahensis]|uniref:Glutathione S-transferase GST-6.0 n=1 Tax=Sphingomonas jeddahensis TaxID=1915074 RepID=A0A1V2EVU6_9SPHN|nr:glutathione S-transferase family protein [Sphingomonas jeddahensis]ONF96617.1 Glutathione S-transferase GST-6.0 [Sphingomonas jeddahensis]
MSDLVFYTNPMSRGRIARWMLEEVGEPYDVRLVDWVNKPDDFLAANPMAKVPTIIHKGRVVTECAAIIAYLADTFPNAALAPTDRERADYYRWMFFAAGPLEAATTNRSLGVVPTEEQQGMVGYGTLDRVVEALKQAVTTHSFIAGDRFTAADVYVGSHIGWGLQFGSLPKCGEFDTYLARINDRPAAVRARELDDALIAAAG